jgi:O-succinylbenzoic acid--CoA ligase
VNLILALESRVERTPDAIAIEDGDAHLTFAALAARSRRGAAYLLSAAPPGDGAIALLMPGDARFVEWFLAIAHAGRPALPVNARLTAGEIARQLADAGIRFLLGDASDVRLETIRSQVPGLAVMAAPEIDGLPMPASRLPGEDTPGDATLAVLLTSGTSGRSKGACLSWGNFEASAVAALERLGPAVRERWLACMPLFHVGGLSILVRSVLYGGPIRLLSKFDAPAVSEALDAGDIAGISLVPTMLSRLLAYRAGRLAPAGLQVLLLGGAAASPELLGRAHDTGFPVCTTYGLTEATSQVATARPWTTRMHSPPPMLPLPGTEVRILLDECDAPAGEPGEIIVRGPTVMKGYYDDSTATERAIRGGWLYTGDIGFLDAAGGLHVLDRRDDLIVSGGENVYPAEIEAVLLEHPSVVEAGVAGLPDADLGARVVAWIVLRGTATADARSLSEHCAAQLAGYKRPREFRFVTALPRTASGKLQRRRLTESAANS